MAKFPFLTFTSKGTQMLVQAQNGHTLTFTCGKLGSGTLSDSDDISQFTDLKAPKMTLPITKTDDSNPEKIVLTFDTSNTSLETGFVSRELGIFAKLDNGAETLYAYSNAGNNYDYIPSKDTPSDENRLVVNLIVSSSASIAVTVDKSIVYAHMSDLAEQLKEHDTNPDAHSALAAVIDDALTPTANAATLATLLSNLANEVKQNKGTDDWKTAPATNLATLAALVGNLASGSDVTWEGNKFTNAKLGITGLMEQNGYICFGKNLGGLILQWGRSNGNTKTWVATLPISSSQSYLALAGDAGNGAFPIGADANSNTIRFYQQTDNATGLYYFVISKV